MGNKEELRTVVIFTEGKNSEPDYINGLMRLPHVIENAAINLEIHPAHGVPLTLVEMAVARNRDPEVDHCWCLFDVEWPQHHPNLNETINLARGHGIELAVSNPCFELWLILHHQEHGAFCDTDSAESMSKRLDGRTGKSVDADAYLPLRKEAARRAERLERRHIGNGTKFPEDNPSSGMYRLVQYLDKMGESDSVR